MTLTISILREQAAKMAPEFARVLPPGVSQERFTRVVLTAVQNNPDLLETTPDSLWNAAMKAAEDGLLPDGREGAIVIRRTKEVGKTAHWMPMTHGLIAKAKRRGSIVNLVANVVYEGEPFQVLLGDEDRIVHRRELSLVQRGKECAVYAIATLKDGTKEREVMTWDQIEHVRASSLMPNKGPWVDHTDEMARKTVIRRLSKRLPTLDDGDDELRQAVERVDELYPRLGRRLSRPPLACMKPEPAKISQGEAGPAPFYGPDNDAPFRDTTSLGSPPLETSGLGDGMRSVAQRVTDERTRAVAAAPGPAMEMPPPKVPRARVEIDKMAERYDALNPVDAVTLAALDAVTDRRKEDAQRLGYDVTPIEQARGRALARMDEHGEAGAGGDQGEIEIPGADRLQA